MKHIKFPLNYTLVQVNKILLVKKIDIFKAKKEFINNCVHISTRDR
jgi:hypothetical protein